MNYLIPVETTVRLLLIIGSYYGLVLFFYWKANITNFDRIKESQLLLIFFVFIHLLFAFEGGDYYHYYQKVSTGRVDSYEEFYKWLAFFVGYDYLMFRTIVWGGAFLFFILTAKRLGCDVYKVTYLLYIMYFTIFDYARASLGMSVFFFGLSFWCMPIKHYKILSYVIIGPLIMLMAPLFHTSMYLALLVSWFVLIPINKKILITVIVLFSISSSIIFSIYSNTVNMIIIENGEFSDKIASYSDQVKEIQLFSIYEIIRKYVEYATIIFPMILMSFKLFDKQYKGRQHTAMIRLYKVTTGIILMAVSLLIATDTIILFYRILFFSIIPITILFYYSRKEGIITPVVFKTVVISCILNVYFNYSKRIMSGNI